MRQPIWLPHLRALKHLGSTYVKANYYLISLSDYFSLVAFVGRSSVVVHRHPTRVLDEPTRSTHTSLAGRTRFGGATDHRWQAIIRHMTSSKDQFLAALKRQPEHAASDPAAMVEIAGPWKYTSDQQVSELIAAILEHHSERADATPLDSRLLGALFESLAHRYVLATPPTTQQAEPLSPATFDLLAELYNRLGLEDESRYQILRLLALAAEPSALKLFSARLVADPPAEPRQIDAACVPLFQAKQLDADALYPKLFEAFDRPILAAIALDLGNHLWRRRMVDQHPAAVRIEQLATLLKAMAQRLRLVEEQPGKYAETQQQLQLLIGESATLVISLCDALGLIGDPAAIPALNTVLELRHRRLQAEAATALARLGEQFGIDRLVELAADPAARTRALAYLEELELLDKVSEEHRTPAARAEAQLSSWLAEPQQIGLAPQSVEVVDQRRQFWPGYEEPQDCFLVRYEYPFPQGTLIGIGLVGPVTYCLAVDLQDLSPTDIYSIYAGWHAEHPELSEDEVSQLEDSERQALQMAGRELDAENVELALVGRFFGSKLPVYQATRSQQPGFFVVDGDSMSWYGAGSTTRPLGPVEAYWIHIGRRLLDTFNPGAADDADSASY